MTSTLEMIPFLDSDSTQVFSESKGTAFHLYLFGEIKEPNNYIAWFEMFRSATENDDVYIHINSEGGDVQTALQIRNYMIQSPATVITCIEGYCMSAATIVFLAGDGYIVHNHSVMMVHNYSGAVIGKGGEMFDEVTFSKNWFSGILEEVYEDFLTTQEIDSLINNKDIWFGFDEIEARLNKMADAKSITEE